MDITRQLVGEKDSTYSYSLNNLAALYHSMGLYSKAEPLYLQALEVRKQVYGVNHPNYATSLNNIGTLYLEMGQGEKSEPYFLQARDIRRKSVGEMHADYAMSLNNLAAMYEDLLEYPKAEALYVQSQDIKRKIFGEAHPDYAMGLNNLAGLYAKMKQYTKSETALTRAAAIWKQVYGEKHPIYATVLNNLAAVYRKSRSRYDQSEKLYQQAIALRKEVLGENHPLTADTENDLALLYSNMKQYNRAAPYLLSSSRVMLNNLVSLFSILSEKEKARYLDYNFVYLETNNSFLYNHPQPPGDILRNCFDLQLAYKSLSLADTRNMLERVRNSKDTAIARILRDWQTSKLILSHQYSLPLENRMAGLELIEAKAELLEKELSRRSAEFRNQQSSLQVNMKQVQEKLQPDEAAIEFVRFRLYTDQWADTAMYAAYIVKKQDAVPVFVPLCRESAIDRISEAGGRSATNLAKVLYRSLEVSRKSMPGDSLYALLWKPLEKYLAGIQKVSYSPAGKLFGIAFHALPFDSSRYLIDKYQLQQYTSTRQIAFRGTADEKKQPGNIVLFGDALFTMDSLQLVRKKTANPSKDLGNVSMISFNRSETAGSWNNLPGTADEVRQIAALFSQRKVPNRVFTQTEASEENMKSLNGESPVILHVATHGFFLPESKKRSAGNENPYSLAKDPLLRSGLVLAGANYTWSGKKPLPGVEDGIATAYEISQMDLGRTDLVVLSACETGLGDIKGSEGVFGLQRSFKIAGVKNLVVSLWQVPDKETVELMTSFYSYRMEGKSIPESFNLAQTAMRRKYPPFYWAAFVLVE
jgi:CHAT domain-containing protein